MTHLRMKRKKHCSFGQFEGASNRGAINGDLKGLACLAVPISSTFFPFCTFFFIVQLYSFSRFISFNSVFPLFYLFAHCDPTTIPRSILPSLLITSPPTRPFLFNSSNLCSISPTAAPSWHLINWISFLETKLPLQSAVPRKPPRLNGPLPSKTTL